MRALGGEPRGLIFHRDRGSEYVAARLRDRLRTLGIRQSATCRGPAANAHMESFWHSLKAEVVHGTRFATDEALRQALARYIRYYNHRRLHSALGYRSPVAYEQCAAYVRVYQTEGRSPPRTLTKEAIVLCAHRDRATLNIVPPVGDSAAAEAQVVENVAVVFSTQQPTIAITDFSYNLLRRRMLE